MSSDKTLINDVLLWQDVPDDDWRKKIVELYGLDAPPGYWRREEPGYPWMRGLQVSFHKETDAPEKRQIVSALTGWPVERPTGKRLTSAAGSPEAVAAWSPEAMREYAGRESVRNLEVDHGQYPKPPVLPGQVWAWWGHTKYGANLSSPHLVTVLGLMLPDEPCILLSGPHAPWYGPFGRFTDAVIPAIPINRPSLHRSDP